MFLFSVFALVVVAIARFFGSVQTSNAQVEAAALTVAQLQAKPPEWHAVYRLSSDTLFGNKATVWFEALDQRTFLENEHVEQNYRYLNGHYVRMLQALKGYMSGQCAKVWAKEYDSSQPHTITDAPAEAQVLHPTLEWMHGIARDHNSRLREKRSPSCEWNETILESTLVNQPSQHAGSPFMPQTRSILTMRINPKALEAEIERLLATDNAPAELTAV
jgi:hypothetical protein